MATTAFARLLRVHAELTRALSATLEAEHGLTISDLEVMLRLANAPEQRMKRVELAASVLLTPSGITRLLDGLEAEGLVARAACPGDRRITYAVLTEAGNDRLRAAFADHVAELDALLGERLSRDGIATLADLLGRLSEPDDGDACGA